MNDVFSVVKTFTTATPNDILVVPIKTTAKKKNAEVKCFITLSRMQNILSAKQKYEKFNENICLCCSTFAVHAFT